MIMSYLDVPTTDPAFNLALEQYVFDCLPRDRGYFMLWQNDNTIVVGRHQNTLAEINEDYVRTHGVQVVRRLSGGGAVYHDLGNLNFTFIVDSADQGQLDFGLFCRPVSQALKSLGVDAQINGRNDITINGKKFSGNAQYVREGRVMHHGTIMFDSDLSAVAQALRVAPDKIKGKGIPSVRSRVTNVRDHLPADLTLAQFKAILVEEILRGQEVIPCTLTQQDLAAVEELRRERYSTWSWNYGRSPACTLLRRERFDGCGLVEAHISLDHGIIQSIQFTGDFFSTVEPEELAGRLAGQPLTLEACTLALDGVDIGQYFMGLDQPRLLKLLYG